MQRSEGRGGFLIQQKRRGPLMRVRHRPKIAANEPLQTATVDSWAHCSFVVLLGGAVYIGGVVYVVWHLDESYAAWDAGLLLVRYMETHETNGLALGPTLNNCSVTNQKCDCTQIRRTPTTLIACEA